MECKNKFLHSSLVHNYEQNIPTKKEKKSQYSRLFEKKKNKNRQASAAKQAKKGSKKNICVILNVAQNKQDKKEKGF